MRILIFILLVTVASTLVVGQPFQLLWREEYPLPGCIMDVVFQDRMIYVAVDALNGLTHYGVILAYDVNGTLVWNRTIVFWVPGPTSIPVPILVENYLTSIYFEGGYLYATVYARLEEDYDVWLIKIDPHDGRILGEWATGWDGMDEMAYDLLVEGRFAWIAGEVQYEVEGLLETDAALFRFDLEESRWGWFTVLGEDNIDEKAFRIAKDRCNIYLMCSRGTFLPTEKVLVKFSACTPDPIVVWNVTLTLEEDIPDLDVEGGYLYLLESALFEPGPISIYKYDENGLEVWSRSWSILGFGMDLHAVKWGEGARVYIAAVTRVFGTEDCMLVEYREGGPYGADGRWSYEIVETEESNEGGFNMYFDSGLIAVAGVKEYYCPLLMLLKEDLNLSDFPWLFTSDAAFIIGDTGGHGPYGFGARTVDVVGAIGVASAVSSATGAGSAQLLDTRVSSYSSSVSVDWSTLPYTNLVVVGGPGVNTLSLYYNGSSPFPWLYKPGVESCIYSTISGLKYRSGYRRHDYAVIWLHYDESNYRNVLVVWGLSGWGTQAACHVLQHYQEYSDLLRGSAVLIKWTNTNNNYMVDSGDEFELIEHWP